MVKSISRRKLVQRLHKLGFSGPLSGGRHLYMVKGVHKVRIPNPHQKDIHKALIIKIIHQVGISPDEWEDLS